MNGNQGKLTRKLLDTYRNTNVKSNRHSTEGGLRHFENKFCYEYFQVHPVKPQMPMFGQTFKKWYFRSLFHPFWPIFRPRWVKMTKNYFFLNSEAKPILTRGHMPMFGQTFKKWYFRSQNGLLGPKNAKK